MNTERNGITYHPDFLDVDYPLGGVYHGTARISFYSTERRVRLGGYDEPGTLLSCRSATVEEVVYLKQHHPEVFQRSGPKDRT